MEEIKTMEIAVIDTGVDPRHFGIDRLIHNVMVDEAGNIMDHPYSSEDIPSHGTICAGIIRKYAPHAPITSIHVLSAETQRASCKKLTAALEWCAQKRVPIVHMSLGSHLAWDFEPIAAATTRLLRQGQHVIAACNNGGRYCMPAYFPGVIGVKADWNLRDGAYRIGLNQLFETGFNASSKHLLRKTDGNLMMTPFSNSYAAPVFTATAYRYLREYGFVSPAELQGKLQNESGITGARRCVWPNLFEREAAALGAQQNLYSNLWDKAETVYDAQGALGIEHGFFHGFLWEKSNYMDQLKALPPMPIDIPVINCSGSTSDRILDFVQTLKNGLHQRGYVCGSVSEFFQAVLQGASYIPDPSLKQAACFAEIQRTQADILLAAIERADISDKEKDIQLVLTDTVNDMEQKNDIILLPADNCKFWKDAVIDAIEAFYTNES